MGGYPLFRVLELLKNEQCFGEPNWKGHNDPCDARFMKTHPTEDPKVTPKPLKWTWADPSKHVVFTVFKLLWNTWEGVGIQFGFCLLSRRVLFELRVTVVEI